MPRPKAYDENKVLDAAMHVFWRKGFAATAMSDIYAATGLKPGNLYATFSDKESLFRRAFEAYAAHFQRSLPTDLSGLPAIRAWLDTQQRLATEDPDRKGCLIVNTVTEREAHSAETRALASRRLEEITAFFRHHLEVARANGELAGPFDTARRADALTGAVIAMMSLARAGSQGSMIAAVAEEAKRSLSSA